MHKVRYTASKDTPVYDQTKSVVGADTVNCLMMQHVTHYELDQQKCRCRIAKGLAIEVKGFCSTHVHSPTNDHYLTKLNCVIVTCVACDCKCTADVKHT